MRRAFTLYQTSPETSKMMPDPVKAMQLCKGMCDEVPSEVSEAVFETLTSDPDLPHECSDRETMAILVSLRMAKEGWRFCPCFPTKRTTEHARIFELVHTNMANRLAHRAMLERET